MSAKLEYSLHTQLCYFVDYSSVTITHTMILLYGVRYSPYYAHNDVIMSAKKCHHYTHNDVTMLAKVESSLHTQ